MIGKRNEENESEVRLFCDITPLLRSFPAIFFRPVAPHGWSIDKAAVFGDSRLGLSGLDRLLARHNIDGDCDSPLLDVPILGREDIDEAYYRPLRREMVFDTTHTSLRNVGVRCCGRDFSYLALRSFEAGDLLRLLLLQRAP